MKKQPFSKIDININTEQFFFLIYIWSILQLNTRMEVKRRVDFHCYKGDYVHPSLDSNGLVISALLHCSNSNLTCPYRCCRHWIFSIEIQILKGSFKHLYFGNYSHWRIMGVFSLHYFWITLSTILIIVFATY